MIWEDHFLNKVQQEKAFPDCVPLNTIITLPRHFLQHLPKGISFFIQPSLRGNKPRNLQIAFSYWMVKPVMTQSLISTTLNPTVSVLGMNRLSHSNIRESLVFPVWTLNTTPPPPQTQIPLHILFCLWETVWIPQKAERPSINPPSFGWQ